MPRQWTEAQKAERAEQVRKYWATHRHPSEGSHHSLETREKMRKPKHRRKQIGTCVLCGRALYSPESARRGMGAECAGLQ